MALPSNTHIIIMLMSILMLSISSPISSQSLSPSPAPAPAPSPPTVNLTDLLSLAGPFHTFLNLLLQTNVIQTFQNQANDTKHGITIFVPTNSAFAEIKKPSLSNLSKDQLKSLALYHAFPNYYSLSDFRNLSLHNPVGTFAEGQYTLNLTDTSGLIRVSSDWSSPKISSSVYSTYPAAVYEVNSVLLPKAIVAEEPTLAPAPAPAPTHSPVSDSAPPAGQKGGGSEAPKSSESGNNDSSSRHQIAAGGLCYLLAAAALGASMLIML